MSNQLQATLAALPSFRERLHEGGDRGLHLSRAPAHGGFAHGDGRRPAEDGRGDPRPQDGDDDGEIFAPDPGAQAKRDRDALGLLQFCYNRAGGGTVTLAISTPNCMDDKNKKWSGPLDLNQRPLAPHASALPGCATPRPECFMIPAPVCIVTANPEKRGCYDRPKSSSSRSMSSSPTYDPVWTSMTITSSRPTFSIRWTAPCGMSREWPASIRISSPSRLTRASPATRCQCSARCRCLCRLIRFPGRTRNRLTLHPFSS